MTFRMDLKWSRGVGNDMGVRQIFKTFDFAFNISFESKVLYRLTPKVFEFSTSFLKTGGAILLFLQVDPLPEFAQNPFQSRRQPFAVFPKDLEKIWEIC
jgi:hypothetical protein